MSITIGRHSVGEGSPCYIIAEIGVNHDGNEDKARELVSRAAACGVQAVKFQVFSADRLVTAAADKAAYQKTADDTESQYDMLKRLELPQDAFPRLADHCGTCGVDFLATPFGLEDLELVLSLGVPAVKIGSGELTNHTLLRAAGRSGKPVILSTGMADSFEAGKAVDCIFGANNLDLILLHCVSNYPARPESINLKAMRTMRREFNVPVGFSDHTLGNTAAIAAVSLGACVIEKHFTLRTSDPGPDHASSADPDQFADYMRQIRLAESMLGDGRKQPAESELAVRNLVRKSLTITRDMSAGQVISLGDVTVKRPGNGITPDGLDRVTGKKLLVDVKADTTLMPDMIENY